VTYEGEKMSHDTAERNPFSPVHPDDVEYTRASRQFGFDLHALRSVEPANPGKILVWGGQWDIKLNSGREVYVAEWRQYGIYAGVLCGVPRGIAYFLWEARKEARKYADEGPIAFLEPSLRRIGPLRNDDDWAELLPPVCTIARLHGGEARRDDEGCFSSIVVVWFQERFGLPYDEDVLDQLRALDWENRATDWEP
jgi:hypothetical protein